MECEARGNKKEDNIDEQELQSESGIHDHL